MSLKSIRESYSKLLTTFNDAGIKLNESQKSDLDTFVLALESTMSKQRESAIRKTKKAVTEKLEKEFKTIFESLRKNMSKNAELASKIQCMSVKLTEARKISKDVNDYLDLYIESVLPKKTIIDYDRMQKLEKLHESLKDLLVVNDDAVEQKKKQLDESLKSEKSKCQTEVAKIQVKLNESMKKTAELKRKIEQFKALELLESKTKDLPTYEARKLKKIFAESTTDEIEDKFDKTLQEVKEEAQKDAEEQETTIESEINDIIKDDDMKENDILKGKVHNGHIVEKDDDQEEEFNTMEEVQFNEDGDIELDESEVIDAATMKYYCDMALERS